MWKNLHGCDSESSRLYAGENQILRQVSAEPDHAPICRNAELLPTGPDSMIGDEFATPLSRFIVEFLIQCVSKSFLPEIFDFFRITKHRIDITASPQDCNDRRSGVTGFRSLVLTTYIASAPYRGISATS